jgi:hypothetical protein
MSDDDQDNDAQPAAAAPVDPVRQLLTVADAIADFALTHYAGPRDLTPAQAGGFFLERRRALELVAEAGQIVVEHDYGPRAPLGDVEQRVGALTEVCERILNWAARCRGLAPPELPKHQELPEYPPWDERTMHAEGERITIWRDLAAARERLERLRPLATGAPKGAERPPDLQPPLPPARHSCDFSHVHWYGANYYFTAAQAAVVAILWREWKKGTPDVRHETLLEETGATTKRFADLFKGSPAWGEFLIAGGAKGTARLAEPKKMF